MRICRRKLLLAILIVGNIFTASAQLDTSVLDSNKVTVAKPKFLRQLVVPAALLGYGTLSLGSGSLRQLDRYINNSTIGQHGYSGSVDDYLRYGPIAAVYGLDIIGVKAKHHFIDRSAMLLISMAITSSAVTFTKNNIYRMRPDRSGTSSFPSSHTAMAFMAAEFMRQEYGKRSVWFNIVGYSAATFTDVLRMYHHIHWFSDVVMGAGYGILATRLAYLVYPYLRNVFLPKKNDSFVVLPTPYDGHLGFSIKYTFKQ
ncbi:PAP2 family protein [Pedobacter chinensis]|uniref:PAP2 family protein n=1 Tax=Pedobacter chinensis TaxID=2282421 RepID=A0A369PWT8_9SPHI|nr:phosphatase PAP2 family protein [Pedobacter chinensis]RDC55655.1 PAP2 family protein [Pedobacter chinensis]